MAHVGVMIGAWRCRRLAAALVDYATGESAPAIRRRVERHVTTCEHCAATAAALADLPAVLRSTAPARDEAFWRAQRARVMQTIASGARRRERPSPVRFDWRLALPLAAAVAIALAGYLSLRPPAAPGEIALDVLPAEDLAALVTVAEGIMPPQELLPDVGTGGGDGVNGAVDAGWIRAADPSTPAGWGELDDDDLEALHGMLG